MRLLLLSDVHANLEAFAACLNAAPEFDHAACLGDVVGYGADPNACVERVRSLCSICVRGNHDRACANPEEPEGFHPAALQAALWTRRTLTPANLDWLRQMPAGPIRDAEWEEAQFVHGSPLDEDTYIASTYAALEALQVSPFRLTFHGHTHIQGAFALRGREATREAVRTIATNSGIVRSRLQLEEGVHYLVNPGAVGQPRDHDRRAAFALYDNERHQIDFYRVPYAIARAQEKILAAGLPPGLATRLDSGR